MRLRLRIERNALPPVQTLWPVRDTSCTVAQLLQQINDTFPLEADTWGYEDYALTLAGYELLHYHVIKDALKEEDEVVIKPLRWEDMRSRTMTGRDQITVDGRHLLDGVAFGRTPLRGTTRPEIRIPPRKKRRLDQGLELVNGDDDMAIGVGGELVAAGDEDETTAPLLLQEGPDDSEESDVPYSPGDADDSDDSDTSDGVDDDPDFQVVGAFTRARAETHQGSWHSNASSDTSSSEDDSSGVSSNSSSSSSSDDSSSDSSSESDEEDSWDGIANNEPPPTASKTKKATPNGVTPPKQQSPPKTNGTSKSKQQASNDSQATADVGGLPNAGTNETHNRNVRRREAKRLKFAKASGAVHQDTTLAQYRDLRNSDGNTLSAGDRMADANNDAQVNGANEAVNAAPAENATYHVQAFDTTEATSNQEASKKRKRTKKADIIPETAANIEDRRQQLIKAISSGGIDVNENLDGGQEEASSPEELTSKDQAGAQADSAEALSMASPPSANTRRAKLDLAGSQRLLYGSLGVRVPKTQAEKEALQKKLAEKNKHKSAQRTEPAETNDESSATLSVGAKATDTPESWQDKINLTAVECVDENITLSAPPFPFHQRWDPQYSRKGKKRMSSTYMEGGGKKRKRGNAQMVNEQYDKYNADGYGDALNYDEEGEDDDEYWEDGALLDGDGDEDEEVENAIYADFPALPTDLTALPLLTSASEAKVDDIITFTELACDESTGWQPKMAARTAKILTPAANGEESCRIQLSYRDVKPPSYDDEGNRVWSKFEMPQEDGEETEEDGRVREAVWAELGEVRVVRKAA